MIPFERIKSVWSKLKIDSDGFGLRIQGFPGIPLNPFGNSTEFPKTRWGSLVMTGVNDCYQSHACHAHICKVVKCPNVEGGGWLRGNITHYQGWRVVLCRLIPLRNVFNVIWDPQKRCAEQGFRQMAHRGFVVSVPPHTALTSQKPWYAQRFQCN